MLLTDTKRVNDLSLFGLGHRNLVSPAVTLVELLIVLVIISVMTLPVAGALRLSVDRLYTEYDRRMIEQRSDCAVSILNYRVYYCASGLPIDKDMYRKAFGGSNYASFYWDGPISVLNSPSGLTNGELRLVYIYPQGIRLKKSFTFGKDGQTIDLTSPINPGSLESRLSGIPYYLKNCVLFNGIIPARTPLIVRWIGNGGRSLQVESMNGTDAFSLGRGEELNLLCAMRVYSKSGKLYGNDMRQSGEQPRVDGIEDIRFEFNKDLKKLVVYMLIRGSHVNAVECKVIDRHLWPPYLYSPALAKKSFYRRAVKKTVMHLPNYLP